MELTAEQVRAWVQRSCAEQGVPEKVSDPRAVQQVAAVLQSGRDAPAEGRRDRPVTDARQG